MFEDILDYNREEKSKTPVYRDIFVMGEVVYWDHKYAFIKYHDPSDGWPHVFAYNGMFSGKNRGCYTIGSKVKIVFRRLEKEMEWTQAIYRKWMYGYWKMRIDQNKPIREWEKSINFVNIVAVEVV